MTPLDESFEDENNTSSSPAEYTSLQRTIDSITSSIPPLSIVSDDTTTLSSHNHTLASRDSKKRKVVTAPPNQYNRASPAVPSLVDPVLHNKFTRCLNGSFDSTIGYTTCSDTDSVDRVVKHPLVENTYKMTSRGLDTVVQTPDKLVTHKGTELVTQGMACKEAQKSTELDSLWRQFLASPLYTDWVKCRSPDTNSVKPGMCYCTCEELKQTEYRNWHCTKVSTKPQMTAYHDDTTSTSNNANNTTSTTNKSSDTTLYTDTAVQTSPSLLMNTKSTHSSDTITSDALLSDCPCVSSHVIRGSPPSSDSSCGDHQGSCVLTGSFEQPASLTQLSLQEACRLFKRDFITNCRHRQKMINSSRKLREEQLVVDRHQAALADLGRDFMTKYGNGELT